MPPAPQVRNRPRGDSESGGVLSCVAWTDAARRGDAPGVGAPGGAACASSWLRAMARLEPDGAGGAEGTRHCRWHTHSMGRRDGLTCGLLEWYLAGYSGHEALREGEEPCVTS